MKSKNCCVSPLKNHSEISYRVKCVTVENEREVFGDLFITQQTKRLSCCEDIDRVVSVYTRKKNNLIHRTLEGPDFMEMNRKKPARRASEFTSNPRKIYTRRSKSLDSCESTFTHQYDNMLAKRPKVYPPPLPDSSVQQEVKLTSLVDQLLLDIYGLPAGEKGRSESDSTASSLRSRPRHVHLQKARLLLKSMSELQVLIITLREHINHTGGLLVRQLRRKDYLIAKRDKQCDIITAHLQAYSAKRIEDTKMRFSLTPQPGESGFTQWLDAMKMVAKLQGGIPPEFRKRLWLTLAERHLEQRGVDWKQAEKLCFNEWSNPDDEELGIQIVKDLHRTGCSLFCGAAGRDNQAVLRRVLLGFARWNKSVGYCQGLNVLAALVLQVMDRAESSAVKVMIYLIEGVLPEGYFADNLRGLSVDMAVFRDLLRSRLPKLSKHLEALQSDAKDKATGSSYEPPLTNVFTMQWFLTLFCHCLPQEAVLRVWDLIFLEGDEVLLRTALAIWEGLSDRIMTVTSADEFYSIMGVLTREMLEFTDTSNLIKNIVNMGPLHGVTGLREKHRYNITPWARKLSDDEDSDTEDDERLAVAAAAMFSMAQRIRKDRLPATMGALQAMAPNSDRERLALDISTLKQQYAKLRERQRQAHIILSAACARQSMVPPPTSQAMNHLLVGKSALVSGKSRPLSLQSATSSPKTRSVGMHSPRTQSRKDKQGVTLHWKDTKRQKQKSGQSMDTAGSADTLKLSPQETATELTSPKQSNVDSDSDSTSTELCDEPDRLSDVDSEEPSSISDPYVMATDDEKSRQNIGSPSLVQYPIRFTSDLKNDNTDEVKKQCLENETLIDEKFEKQIDNESEISIAKITDQIRRLSSEDDNNPISNQEGKAITDITSDRMYVDSEYKTVSNQDSNKSSSISSSFNYLELQSDQDVPCKSTISPTYNKDQTNTLDKIVHSEVNLSENLLVTNKKDEKCIEESLTPQISHNTKYMNLDSKSNKHTDEVDYSDIGRSEDFISMDRKNGKRVEETNYSKISLSDKFISIERKDDKHAEEITNLKITKSDRFMDMDRNDEQTEETCFSKITRNGKFMNVDRKDGKHTEETVDLKKLGDDRVDISIKDEESPDVLNKRNSDIFSPYDITLKKMNYSTSARSLDIDNNSFSKAFTYSSNYSTRKAESFDISSVKSPNSTDADRAIYSKSYVVGHLPISPINVDKKLNKLSNISCETSTVSIVTPENSTIYTNATITSERSVSRYDQPRTYIDVKDSPKTPESTKSVNSGDTTGPDSKPFSLTMSSHSPLLSESQDFVMDKSVCSSVSSDSKTLVHSIESDGEKKSSKSDSKKDSCDKSNPSTPISADSLGIKSDPSPKFIISSSSDSCSPSKVKSSERSFSSDLQSPISANSIKYTSNYNKRGQDNISDSPHDMCSNTSPFYPIAHPNQKTPSPYNAERRRRSVDSTEASPEQKSLSSKESTKESDKYVGYPTKLDPSMKIVDAREGTSVMRKGDVYIRPQFMASREDVNIKLSATEKHDTESNSSLFGSTFNNLYIKTGRYTQDATDDQSEKDTLSQLPHEKLDKHFHSYNYRRRDRSRLLERSSSSLDRKFSDLKSSASIDEFSTTMAKKRSSDILEDMKHLEAKALSSGTSNSSMMTKKASDIWEDLKILEARRQDTFSDSASSFSKHRLDIPNINITAEGIKSYVVHPKINIDENSDSILNTVARAKESGACDDGRESKLGVWTKVKPRKKGDNGRRSSDRALKIIQENSAILHKILACQARKRLPDLEEISKEITISPINEEISKIFSPILEKMGLNEDEINEELARINFQDIDSVATSVSEFDAKINDELSKLSLIDDTEQFGDAGEVISHEYLDTREALLDRKINEELSRLLANYEDEVCSTVTHDKVSPNQNISEIDDLDLPTVSTNVFSYKSPNDSIDARSDFVSAQDPEVHMDKYPHYTENVLQYTSPQYVQTLSPKSDIDIYRELEKLDKISSGRIFPDTTLETPQKTLSPISYTPTTSPYLKASSTARYSTKCASYDTSPRKPSYDLYKSFDFEPNISPRKQPTDLYSSSTYDKPAISTTYDYSDHISGISTETYDLLKSPVLSKESLEFRVRYDEESPRQASRDYTSLQKNDREFMNLDKSSMYYDNSHNKPVTPTKYGSKDENRLDTACFVEYSVEDADSFRHKYEPFATKNYSDSKMLDYDRHMTALPTIESEADARPYLPNKHREYQSLSPSSRYNDHRYPLSMEHYASKLSSGLNDDLKRPVSHPEFPDKTNASIYTESPSKGSSCYKKSSLSLSNIGHTTKNIGEKMDATPSPKPQFSPFPVRNAPRKPKELGLKLGLYSSKSSDTGQLKKS